MNSAPAELLHPLIDAALQPLSARVFFHNSMIGKRTHRSQRLAAASIAKKTPAVTPASEFDYFVYKRLSDFPKKTPPCPI
jgi:hypothetical protein